MAQERAHRDAEATSADPPAAATSDQATREARHSAGPIPPVNTGTCEAKPSASEQAFEDDDNARELKTKVSAMVAAKFGGDYKKGFAAYDANKDGAIDKDELSHLLSDAHVGNGLTRGMWASKIIEKLDANCDQAISWTEFESVFKV